MPKSTSSTLQIDFGSPEAAEHFKQWLSGQGEQDYWVWMDCREMEESGDITVRRFHYGSPNVIGTTMGRLDTQ
jgi:hypothetical protein